VDPQGRVVMAIPRTDYALSVFNPDGTVAHVIEREYETWTRDDYARNRYDSLMEGQSRQFPPGTEREIEDTEADVQYIRCAADGSIWVLNSRAVYTPKDGCLAAWDVFNADGEFIKQVEAHVPGNAASDWMFLTDNGLAIHITGFWDAALAAMGGGGDEDAAAMEIICYRVGS